MPPSRTFVYVDGFNLYYGCLKNTPYKWLNIQLLCELLLTNNDIRKIYYFTASTGKVERITNGGYCAAPGFSEKKQTVAYSKLVGNDMQLFLYTMATKQHTQLTFDKGTKEECSWSPCGNYLTYMVQEGAKSRIAILNMITQEQFFLTAEHELCSYPAWSPRYG